MHTIQAWLNSGAQITWLCWIHPKEGVFELVAKVASRNSRLLLSLPCTISREHPVGYFSNSSSKKPWGWFSSALFTSRSYNYPFTSNYGQKRVCSPSRSGPCAHPWNLQAGSAPSESCWLVVLARWFLRGEPQDMLHSRYLPVSWILRAQGEMILGLRFRWETWVQMHSILHSLNDCGLVTFSHGASDSSFARWGIWTRWFWWPHPAQRFYSFLHPSWADYYTHPERRSVVKCCTKHKGFLILILILMLVWYDDDDNGSSILY